jgi:hypothetical protein
MTFAEAKAQMDMVAAAGHDVAAQQKAGAVFLHGPREVVEGARNIRGGELSRGVHRMGWGAILTAAPFVAPQLAAAMVAAPVATGVTIATGLAGQQAGYHGGKALGLSEDQATLVGDVTGLGGGLGGAKLAAAGARAVQRRVVPALRQQAGKKVEQALGPTKERFKAMTRRITPEILKRNLHGSRASILKQAEDAAEAAGTQIDDAVAQYGERPANTEPIIRALETAKSAFRTRGTNGALVEYEPRSIRQLERLQQVLVDLGPDPSVGQVIAIRRAWDRVVDQAGGFAHRAGGAIGIPLKDQSEAWAKREATAAIRRVLGSEVPELSALNKEFTFWKSLEDILTQTLQRTAPQHGGLHQVVVEAAGAAAASSRGLGAAWATGKVAGLLSRVVTSPRWRLMDARVRNRLAEALASGSADRVRLALPAGATQLGPVDDASFVRGVAGEPARRDIRGLLPGGPHARTQQGFPSVRSAGRGSTPAAASRGVTPLAGDIAVDPSDVRGLSAAAISHEIDPLVPVKQGGVRVSQYSGDPRAVAQGVVTKEIRPVLQRMLDDLNTFEPERGRIIRDPNDWNSGIYAHGGPGSAVGDDIRIISEQNVSNRQIKAAIKDLLAGRTPKNRLHTAALDAAMGYLEKRPGYRGPVVPGAGDDGFEVFSRAVDDLAGER